MKSQDVKNITLKALQIKIKEAAAKGSSCISIDEPLPDYVKNFFVKKGFEVYDYEHADFTSLYCIIPARPARIYWK